jgi:NAD(P)-dependent dehydrogenase (short-subunit alcohol dehydrogenase family)
MNSGDHDATRMRLDGFAGRVAVVSGSGRGIGWRIAETLLAQGAAVAVLDLKAPQLGQTLGIACDVTDASSVDNAFAEIERELGPAAILVLNAGVYIVEPFESVSDESWRTTMAVNLDGAFLCARRAIGGMRLAGYGRIVAVGSSAGISGGKRNTAAYAASKAGLMALVKALANEYASEGITANAVAPALIRTSMIAGMPDLLDLVPVGRYGEVDDVAAAVAFLCSAHASYVTGETLDVNGGFFIH